MSPEKLVYMYVIKCAVSDRLAYPLMIVSQAWHCRRRLQGFLQFTS